MYSDGDQEYYKGRGNKKAIDIIQNQLSILLSNRNIKEQKQIDEILLKYLGDNKSHINLIQPLSFSLSSIISEIQNKQLFQYYQEEFEYQPKSPPKLFINMLQGSKSVGSKCKVFRYLLIVNEQDDPFQSIQMVQTITSILRKNIASGKLGESGLKFHQDGTILCIADTISDNLKLLETAIDSAGLKDKVNIGLVWMADLFFNPDQKKYELENPKQLLDVDQLIDFYMKLCTDRPIISYLEDPIQSEDIQGWQKIINKFKDHRVKIGSRILYSNLDKVKKYTDLVTKESNPELTDVEITNRNDQRVLLNYAFIRPYDFSTFSQFTQLAKYITSKRPQINLILGDNLTDTLDTCLVDLVVKMFSMNQFSIRNAILNISSPLKYQKIIKLSRYLEIAQQIKV